MPKRRTQDVIRVVMTDHWIRRQPGGSELVAPLTEAEPVLTGIRLIGSQPPQGALGEVYRAAAVVRVAATAEAVAYLEKMLAAAQPAEIEPWLDLAQRQIRRGRFADAERTLQVILARAPENSQVLEWLALAHAGQKRPDEALDCWRRALEIDPTYTDSYLDLGRALLAKGDREEALRYLRHGARAAAKPDAVTAALQEAERVGQP